MVYCAKILCIFFVFITLTAHAQKSATALIHHGNQAFLAEDYDKASGKYLEAVKTDKNSFEGHYNLGNSLYKQKKYKEADAEYAKAQALARNNFDRAAVSYNRGNVQMMQKESGKAVDLYKAALKKDPANESIRKNLEIAMIKQKQQQQNQQQQNPKQQNQQQQNGRQKEKQQNDGHQQKSPQQQNPEQDQQQQNGQGGKNQQGTNRSENGNGDKQNQNNGQPTPRRENPNMPRDLEKEMLSNTADRESNTARKIMNRNSRAVPESREKDW